MSVWDLLSNWYAWSTWNMATLIYVFSLIMPYDQAVGLALLIWSIFNITA